MGLFSLGPCHLACGCYNFALVCPDRCHRAGAIPCKLGSKPINTAHFIRMRSFMSGKHGPISAVNGTSGTPSLPLLLACGFHRMLQSHFRVLILSKRYLASWVILKPLLILDFLPDGLTGILSNASALRFTNFFGSFVLAAMVRTILLLNTKVHDGPCDGEHLMTYTRCKRCRRWSGRELIHTGVNIYLFPPLFFFYGLYYTDVLSVTCVLYAYRCYLTEQESSLIIGGLLSLLFRQTNIFWVSVFLGGLELCRTIPTGRPGIDFPNQPTFHDIIEGSWRHASAYDPTISQACFEGHNSTPVMQKSR